ncbi:MAG: DUF5011 domain-containing protein, partial [Patescibacteria group bacterium]|nr:DUF5011 domain-containing protein [Patescibacteria group bacterium]
DQLGHLRFGAYGSGELSVDERGNVIVASTTGTTSPDLLTKGPWKDASDTLKNAVVGLGDIVVNAWNGTVYAVNGIYDKVFAREVHTDTLCVSDSSGETCITKAQLDKLLAGAGVAADSASSDNSRNATSTSSVSDTPGSETSTSTPDSSAPSTPPDTEAPTVKLFGNNPAIVPVGSAYADLGASVSDNVDQNIGYKVSVDGGPLMDQSALSLDTSTTTSYTIVYTAVDQAGNIGTATRSVKVQ